MGTKAPVQPTTDIDRAERDLLDHGYALVADDLNAAEMEAMRKRFGDQAIAEAKLRGETLTLNEEFLRIDLGGLLNKGKVWQKLLKMDSAVHQVVDRAMRPTVAADIAEHNGLKQRFILSSLDGTFKRREKMPDKGHEKEGHYALMFHTDQAWMPIHTDFPMAINCFHCLTDYTYENGATVVVPGTHTKAPPPWGEFSGEGAIPVEVPAGTCILVDGRLWHAGGVNTNGELRASCTTYYAPPWFRQRWPMALNLRQEVIDDLSEEQLILCGFDTMFQSEYGAFVGPNIIEPLLGRTNISFKPQAIGELHPD
jgi:ectoine hydroxylase-related dioxygenase (phytanoyl-CoA dioxygenase family)